MTTNYGEGEVLPEVGVQATRSAGLPSNALGGILSNLLGGIGTGVRTVAGGIAGLPQAALEKLKDLAGEIAEAIDSGEITPLGPPSSNTPNTTGGRGPMANRERPGPVGCPPGSYYNPVTDRCEVYGPPPGPRPPTDAEREDIDEAMDRQSNLKAICNGTLDPDSLTDDEIELLTKGTMTRAQLKNTSAWCPTEWLEKDDDSPPSDSPPSGPPPSGPPTRGDDSPPVEGQLRGGTSPGGGGPAPEEALRPPDKKNQQRWSRRTSTSKCRMHTSFCSYYSSFRIWRGHTVVFSKSSRQRSISR